MKIRLCRLFWLMLIVTHCSRANDTAFVNQARLWFEWGEYQKIITEVPIDLANRKCDSVNTECARLHLYLGIGLFAFGQLGESRNEFMAALANNPALLPDKQYISAEMNNFFLAVHSDYLKQISEIKNRDSLLHIQQAASERQKTLQTIALRQKTGRQRSLGATIICYALAAVAASVTWYEYDQSTSSYDQFKTASGAGDLSAYNRYKQLTIRADVFAIIAGIVSVAGATGGTFSLYQTTKRANPTIPTIE
jgi:hypothetical protein